MKNPSTWPEFSCRSCSAVERLPLPPSDGLCADCRAQAAAASMPAVEPSWRRWRMGEVPPAYADLDRATWESWRGPWEESPQLAGLVDWPNVSGPGWSSAVVVYGPYTGQGKTGTAVALMRQAAERHPGWRVAFVEVPRYLQLQRDAINGGPNLRAEATRVRRLVGEADVLVLDELSGAWVHESTWVSEQVLSMVAPRESLRMPTVVTYNAKEWAAIASIHPRLGSLLDVRHRIRFDDSTDHRAAAGRMSC